MEPHFLWHGLPLAVLWGCSLASLLFRPLGITGHFLLPHTKPEPVSPAWHSRSHQRGDHTPRKRCVGTHIHFCFPRALIKPTNSSPEDKEAGGMTSDICPRETANPMAALISPLVNLRHSLICREEEEEEEQGHWVREQASN